MPQYDNTNRGSLFRNKHKKTAKHPDYSGYLDVDGVEHFIDGWLKQSSKDGSTFMSLSIKPKAGKGPPRQREQPAETSTMDDDDIPF